MPVEDTSLVVPARSYTELMRVLTDTDDPVDIMLAPAESQVIFHVDTIELVSRLIDGQFPNYQQVVPTQPLHAAPWSTADELLKAVRLSALIAARRRQRGQAAHRRGRLGRASPSRPPRTSATPRARSRPSLEGDPVTIAFNARYLTEALQNVDGGPAGARVQRPALVGRLPARSTTPTTSTSSCPSGRPPRQAALGPDAAEPSTT